MQSSSPSPYTSRSRCLRFQLILIKSNRRFFLFTTTSCSCFGWLFVIIYTQWSWRTTRHIYIYILLYFEYNTHRGDHTKHRRRWSYHEDATWHSPKSPHMIMVKEHQSQRSTKPPIWSFRLTENKQTRNDRHWCWATLELATHTLPK